MTWIGVLALSMWFGLTALPAWVLLGRRRRPALALGGLAGSVSTVSVWLLLAAEVLPFFDDAWHEASFWLHLGVGLAALNLALAFSCMLFLPAPGPESRQRARRVALVCFWMAMAIVASAGASDPFLYSLYSLQFSEPLVALTVCLLIVALGGALRVWRNTRR